MENRESESRMDQEEVVRERDSVPGAETVEPGAFSASVPEERGGGRKMENGSPDAGKGAERKSSSRCFGCLLGCGCLVLIVLTLVLCIGIFAGIATSVSEGRSGEFSEENMQKKSGGGGKIAVIEISGIILNGGRSYGSIADSEEICRQLDKAEKDPSVRAVILSLNTPGGEVTASDDIHGRILKLKRLKPVVALMNSIAASGGYYVAVACDRIVASRLTLTGSIGVILSTYNYKGLLDKVGIVSEVYKSGEMKDMLNGAKVRTPQEIAVIQELVDDSYAEFVRLVSIGRRIPEEKIRGTIIGDGRVLHGARALKLGLVDRLGRMDAAVAEAEQLAGVPSGSLSVVRYKRNLSVLELLFGAAEAHAAARIQLSLPGMSAGELPPGRLYYLARDFMP